MRVLELAWRAGITPSTLETEPEKWRIVRATLEARRPFRDLVYRSARGDGTLMYVKASGKPVFDANGEFRGYRGTGGLGPDTVAPRGSVGGWGTRRIHSPPRTARSWVGERSELW